MQNAKGGRAELLQLGQRYLDALVLGDPDHVPLTSDYRATENAATTRTGEGLWRTARSFPGYPSLLCDELLGHVVVVGAVETTSLQPIALRLRISGGAIAEAEAIVSSSAHGFFADVDKLLHSDLIYEAPVPAGRGATREELRHIADTYWIALGESDGSLVPVHYRADRFANGKKVTHNLEILLSPDKAFHSISSLLTATRPARPQVREKRFFILDAERGVAVSTAMVDFADDPRNPRPDTGCFYITNILKITDGQIRIIDAIHQILPRGSSSGWGAGEGSVA